MGETAQATLATTTQAVTAIAFNQLPKLGEALAGGKFAGISTDKDGTHFALISLPDTPPTDSKELTFKAALAWAIELGAVLPSRAEAALLFANLKGDFEPFAHWTREEHASDSSFAWYQYFDYGNQHYITQSYALKARAVRRLPFIYSAI